MNRVSCEEQGLLDGSKKRLKVLREGRVVRVFLQGKRVCLQSLKKLRQHEEGVERRSLRSSDTSMEAQPSEVNNEAPSRRKRGSGAYVAYDFPFMSLHGSPGRVRRKVKQGYKRNNHKSEASASSREEDYGNGDNKELGGS